MLSEARQRCQQVDPVSSSLSSAIRQMPHLSSSSAVISKTLLLLSLVIYVCHHMTQ